MQEPEIAQPLFPLREIIEELNRQLANHYVFAEKAQEVAAHLYKHLEQGSYDSIQNGEVLARIITEHMNDVSHDKHLRLFYKADGVAPFVDDNDSYTSDEIEHIYQQKKYNYGLKKIEILEGNIGYFQLNEFVHPHVAGESVHAAMTFLSHTQALIIDLRYNSGGEATMVQFLSSYFFNAFEAEHIQLNGLYDRRKNLLQQYWVLPYVPGARYLNKPIYVLTSQRTFSAAEEFAYNLQQLKRALVIGETTGGGAHAGLFSPVTAQFGAFIPMFRAINPISGTNWEGVGVQPDLSVHEKEAFDIAYHNARMLIQETHI